MKTLISEKWNPAKNLEFSWNDKAGDIFRSLVLSKRIPLLENTLAMEGNRAKGLNIFNLESCSNS